MKRSAFPISIEVEVKIDGIWEITHNLTANNSGALYLKMENIKTLLALDNKTYRITFVLNSKVNSYTKE
jgi:hypothetical protein